MIHARPDVREQALIPLRRLSAAMVAALALCAIPAAYAQQPDPGRGGQRGGSGMRRPMLSEEEREKTRLRIGMTKEQQAQIEAVYAESEKQRREAMQELGEKHRQLQVVYDAYEIDKAQERAILRDIVSIHWKLLRIHSEDEAKIRRILTKEQHEKLRAMIKEAIEAARARWRIGPPKPPGPPSGGAKP